MEYRKFADTYVIRLDKGEEIISSLQAICEKENIRLGSVEGIGAADHAVIAGPDDIHIEQGLLADQYKAVLPLLGYYQFMDWISSPRASRMPKLCREYKTNFGKKRKKEIT